MFDIVIEKDTNIQCDSLIIKDKIDDIVLSIESALYGISENYRPIVRRIKNSLSLLTNINETHSIFLEHDNVSDDNLIPYLTNVLEIAIDTIVFNLSTDSYYKLKLKNINSISELLSIDSDNITVLNSIFEDSKSLLKSYAEVNDVIVDHQLFYNILDDALKSAVKESKNTVPNKSETELLEDRIYNTIILNLDNLIDESLTTTFNNIKQETISIINEINLPNRVAGLSPNATNQGSNVAKWLGIGVFGSLFALGFDKIVNIYNSVLGKTAATSVDIKSEIPKDVLTFINAPKRSPEEVNIILDYYNQISATPSNSSYSDTALAIGLYLRKTFASDNQLFSDISRSNHTIISGLKDQLSNFEIVTKFREENNLDENIIGYGGIVAVIIAAVTGAILVYDRLNAKFNIDELIRFYHVKKQIDRIYKSSISNTPFKSEIQIGFQFLESRISECHQQSKRSNNIIQTYECGLRYLIGSYAVFLYFLLLTLKADGVSYQSFKSISDVYSYKGFAGIKSRSSLNQFRTLHDELIKFHPEFINTMTNLFFLIRIELEKGTQINAVLSKLPTSIGS